MIMNRERLHRILVEILGSENVYFQPPANLKMKYPAIKYSRDRIVNLYADDTVYKQIYAYQIIVIDKNPDSEIVKNVSLLPAISHDRHYTSDNLNHDVFILNL